MRHPKKMVCIFLSIFALTACDRTDSNQKKDSQVQKPEAKADVLPYLNIQEEKAKFAIPFCEKRNCHDIEIQTVQTADPWLNEWITQHLAIVVQDQIASKQDLSLQQAVNAYVKKSDAWQAQFSKNKAYALNMTTKIASQRNQYVLLQISVDSKQEGITVKERQYFFVADRKLQKGLSITDVLNPTQKKYFNDLIQQEYQTWHKAQGVETQKLAAKSLAWDQAEWFFDTEGIGLHYRANQIAKDSTQLDIYLTKQQTQKMIKADVFQKMF